MDVGSVRARWSEFDVLGQQRLEVLGASCDLQVREQMREISMELHVIFSPSRSTNTGFALAAASSDFCDLAHNGNQPGMQVSERSPARVALIGRLAAYFSFEGIQYRDAI